MHDTARPWFGVLVLGCWLMTAGTVFGMPELGTLFPHQAEIFTREEGLARLELPPAVLAQCRSDLSDLRIFDASGTEVPFAVDGGLHKGRERVVQRTLQPALVSVEQSRGKGAERRWTEEVYVLEMSREAVDAREGAGWDLVFRAGAPRFVRKVTVESLEGGDASALVEGASLFRLTEPSRERLTVPLPNFETRRLRVRIEGEEGFFLEPTFRLESSRGLGGTSRSEVPLRELSRRRLADRTLVELERPRGLLPDRLLFSSDTGSFQRTVEIWDDGAGAVEERLGEGEIFRLRSAIAVEDLELSLTPPRGDRLRLVILDGDSPSLEGLTVRAVVRRPALVFELPPPTAAGASTGLLRFGGGRAYRPRYDLNQLLPPSGLAHGQGTERVLSLVDDEALGTARLGGIVSNPAYDSSPVLAFAHRPGIALDTRLFAAQRTLEVAGTSEGLAHLRLLPEDLARLRPDRADLRVVDGEERQWAYLLDEGRGEEVRELPVNSQETEEGWTIYSLELPAMPAQVMEVVLETPASFFDRAFELVGREGEAEVVLLSGRLVRRIGDPRPVRLRLSERRIEFLELRVEDGDDAPLEDLLVTGRFSVPEIYFAAPEGIYTLLLDYPEATAPRYELARVRDVVLAAASSSAAAGPLEENPRFDARLRDGEERGQQMLLWVALGLAVFVLVGLTLRLVRE